MRDQPESAPGPIGDDVDREFALHLELAAERLRARGWPAEAARQEARRRFGDRRRFRAECVAIRSRQLAVEQRRVRMTHLVADVRYALRLLRRTPVATGATLLTLALGIGPVLLLFSVLQAVLLRPLPYPGADRIVMLRETEQGRVSVWASPADFVDWQKASTTVRPIAAYAPGRVTVATGADPLRVDVARVSREFFDVLGSPPTLGRSFTAAETAPGGEPVVILSHHLWRQQFAAQESIVGRSIRIDGRPHAVVGVAPAGFRFPDATDAWVPLVFDFDVGESRGAHYLLVLGRLTGSRVRAQTELDVIAADLAMRFPETNEHRGVQVVPLLDHLVRDSRHVLLLLSGAVALTLLIACANVGNISLARGVQRAPEFAVRSALGAARGRLVGQMLTESGLLATLGGLLGLGLSYWLLPAVVAALPGGMPRVEEIAMDSTVLLAAAGLAIGAGLLVGLVPAFRASRAQVAPLLATAEGRVAGGHRHRLASLLLVCQVAAALALSIQAGLFLRSLGNVLSEAPGFDPRGVLSLGVSLTETGYPDAAARVAFYDRLLERVHALPGVESAAVVPWIPPQPGWSFSFEVADRPSDGRARPALFRPVSHGYFETLGIPLLKGRRLEARDRAGGPAVVVINDVLARREFGDEDPIGRRVFVGYDRTDTPEPREVVGVVGSIREWGLDGPTPATVYLPYPQIGFGSMRLLVKTPSDPHSLIAPVVGAVRALDSGLAVDRIQTLEESLSGAVAPRRFVSAALLLFSLLAVSLALVGIYGLVSHGVAQRTREFGLLSALGASRTMLVVSAIRRALVLAVTGIALGSTIALGIGRLAAGQLYGVTAADPTTWVAVLLLVLGATLAASYLPARRAASLDPVDALRTE